MNEFIKKQKVLLLIKNSLIFLLIFLCSCKEKEIIDLNETIDPQLVIFSEMTDNNTTQIVYLSKTFSDFSDYEENTSVSNACVYIYDINNTIKLTENPNEKGAYYTTNTFIPIADETYTLFIDNVDINNDGIIETYTANTTMGKTMDIESMSIYYDRNKKGWEICMSGKEPEETTNYYLFRVYRNDTLITKKITDYRISKDEFYNGSVLENVIVQFLDKDKGQIIRNYDKITLEVSGITQGYYQFIHDIKEETDDDLSFFQGPSAKILGNISNNTPGYFAIMSVSRKSYIYKEN